MNKKIQIIISASVILFIFVIIFLVIKKNKTDKISTSTTIENVQKTAELKALNDKKYQEDMKALNVILDKKRETDTDLDGLSNEEEKKLGTNPEDADTDHDGLLDGDEVKIFHTDPLKADTDGDGFKDGVEIRNGYNPLGPGKLK